MHAMIAKSPFHGKLGSINVTYNPARDIVTLTSNTNIVEFRPEEIDMLNRNVDYVCYRWNIPIEKIL